MNALRRWIDRDSGRAALLGFLQSSLIVGTLWLFVFSYYLDWRLSLIAAPLTLVNVWLFVAAGTNWRWDGR